MISQNDIDKIYEIPIIDVLSKYPDMSLKKRGVNYIGCCPFHNEKTPSFTVSPAKDIFKCYGCGKGGKSVSFVMEHDKLTWPEALRKIASDHNIKIKEIELTEEQKKEFEREAERRESILVAMKMAQQFFEKHLETNEKAKRYMLNRIPKANFWEEYGVGFAPDGNVFKQWARENKLSENVCIEADVLASHNNAVHDKFQNRFVIPIHNSKGETIGFTGRDLSGSRNDKYNNTKEIPKIYEKRKTLFGLNYAYRSIVKQGFSFLVEGNIDCLTLHSIGQLNCVAVGGSELTEEQIKELSRYTKSVTIIPDNDKTGESSLKKWADKLYTAGFSVKILLLPKRKDIKDVNDFFRVKQLFSNVPQSSLAPYNTFGDKTKIKGLYNFKTYWLMFEQDYLLYYAIKSSELESVQQKGIAVKEISSWLSYMDSVDAEEYLGELGTIWPPKDRFKSRYKEIINKRKEEAKPDPEAEKLKRIPKYVDVDEYKKYGFYERGNKYIFDTAKGDIEGSNFIMRPLFHIESIINSKRMYKIVNEWGIERIIELKQEDLINLSRFKKAVESLGNFIWKTDESCLTKLKSYLYEKTETCQEIEQLGYQDKGFYAWGNGIFDGAFKPVDNIGIVRMGNLGNYYLPAFSDIYKNEPKLFISERKFINVDSGFEWEEVSHKIVKVFGEQAIVGLCFYINTLFCDYTVRKFNFFPLLNMFGPKGAGKTALANCLLKFFGPMPEGPKLPTISLPSLAEYIGGFANALVNADEYKNNLDPNLVEFLKGLWGRIGRTVKNMDRDKKKETSPVNTGVIITGQEMPTADIALFSRVLFLAFYKTEYSESEKREFMELMKMLDNGVSNITNDFLSLRDEFIKNFDQAYKDASKLVTDRLKGAIIEDRIFKNWVIILAGYTALKDKISMPLPYDSIVAMFTDLMKAQNFETKRGSDVANFWSIVEYLYRENLLENEIDYRVEEVKQLRIGDKLHQFDEPTEVLFLDHTKTIMLYRKHGKQTIEQVLPIPTLQYYLQNSKEFLGKKPSFAFKFRDALTKQIVSDNETVKEVNIYNPQIETTKKLRITTAYCFLYKDLGINIKYTETDSSSWDLGVEREQKIPAKPLDRDSLSGSPQPTTHSLSIGHHAKTNSSPTGTQNEIPF